ncbi:hypothetical protein [Candidatus Berkiella aquae]|uniref:Uncharacterized protein n=1 Tax=Candidatus Berkiella aquae TaxID=295108 RepID=A0A0Q9YZV2_9GAMM|nr:hypothetical protein [Candidatus Berkiella aquae]
MARDKKDDLELDGWGQKSRSEQYELVREIPIILIKLLNLVQQRH